MGSTTKVTTLSFHTNRKYRHLRIGVHLIRDSARSNQSPFCGKSPRKCCIDTNLLLKLVARETGLRILKITAIAVNTKRSPRFHWEVESMRLAMLRYHRDDVTETWDKQTVHSAAKFFKDRVLKLTDEGKHCHDDDKEEGERSATRHAAVQDHHSQTKFVARKIMRRPLSAEDQELLRCIGLDAFMALRFLKFSVDVFFWPLLLAIVSLLPLYLTAKKGVKGLYTTTNIALLDDTAKYWLIVFFVYIHFLYILRRLWIEWELFLPLRYDFLDRGDFEEGKYKEQYRRTCLVEYVPASHRHDKALYSLFDALFPGNVKRAEVLLNTEYLRKLRKERMKNIIAYEDAFAKKVHKMADYLRAKEEYRKFGLSNDVAVSWWLHESQQSPGKLLFAKSIEQKWGMSLYINLRLL